MTLVGEPGIGKTRTGDRAHDYARAARRAGAVGPLLGRPVAPALLAVGAGAPLLRPRDRSRAAPARAGCRRGGRSPRSWPRCARAAGISAASPASRPAQARFRLFDSVTAFLRAAREQPLVLVLDDLHWADAGPCACWSSSPASSPRHACSASARIATSSSHAGTRSAETLAELTRERLFERIVLRGLTGGRRPHSSRRHAASPHRPRSSALSTPDRGQPALRDRGRPAARPGG